LLKISSKGQISLTATKIAEICTFGYKFAQKGYTPLSDFYKIGLGERVPGSHPHAKFNHCGLENVGVQPPKSPKLVFFWYKFTLNRFLQNLVWGRESQVCTFVPNFTVVAIKSRKMVIFCINLPLKENYGGPQKNLNIGAQPQTFLHAMTP